jgi:cytochrome P450
MSSIVIKSAKSGPHHPPGPQVNWLTGTVSSFQQNPLQAMIDLWREHGDAVRFRFFANFYGYIFAHPDHLKHIFQDNNRNYTKNPHPSYQLLRPLGGEGLLTSDGDHWRQQRRLAQPAFHRRRIADFGTMMTQATEAMLARWAQMDGRIDLDAETTRLTLEIVGKALFSIDLTGEADTVGQAFTAVNHTITQLNSVPFSNFSIKIPWLPSSRVLNKNIATLDEVVYGIIQQRHDDNNTSEDDLLGMLMAARDEDTGEGMNDKQLRDEVMTLMLAGHETTAHTISWCFYLLSQNPAVRTKLEMELAQVLNGRTPTIADLPHLTYTRMVIDESLRLYPVAYGIARWCNDADEIGGYDIAPNSVVMICPYLTHRHTDFWDEPEKFDPERFTPERSADRPRYAYLPFGGGPRQCIGNTFALTEASLILATIAQKVQLDLPAGHTVEIEPMITLHPKGGMPMLLKTR